MIWSNVDVLVLIGKILGDRVVLTIMRTGENSKPENSAIRFVFILGVYLPSLLLPDNEALFSS
jgi:hypothetical protein